MSARYLVLAALILVSATAVACGGATADSPVEVRVATPTITPIPPTPAATEEPLDPPELVLSAVEANQGGAILVSVTGDVRAGIVRFMGRDHVLEQGDHSMYTFVGIDVDDPPGTSQLPVTVETSNGSRGRLEATLTVINTEWEVDHLYFDPGTADDLLNPEVAAREMALLRDIYSEHTPEKLWDQPWVVPTEGPVTARFGSQRSINDGPPDGNHSGTDVGADTGTPIVATNSGRVLMARQLEVRGNMVIIDHGGGVLSGYAHMHDFAVAEGQYVEAGELLGGVGNTGLSTGPHLHWEMSVNGVLVDPWRFVDGSNGF